MKVNPINNNQTSFGAIKFRNQKSQKRFMSELKKLPIEEFEKALDYIKAQEDNFVRITIAINNKLPEVNPYGGRLKWSATIGQNEDTVNAGWNFVNFIKDCASSANRVRQKYYNEAIEKGEDTVRGVKGRIYLNALAGLSNTDLPKTLY